MVTEVCRSSVGWWVLFIGVLGISSGVMAEEASAASVELEVAPREDCTAGGLAISHGALPGNTLAFLSCEAVLFGEPTESTPLFEVNVGAPGSDAGVTWEVTDDRYRYVWTYDEGIRVAFQGTRRPSSLHLEYTLTNLRAEPLKRVLLHTCVPTTDAPAFFPEWVESPIHEPGATGHFMALYERVFLWSDGKRFSFGETARGKKEIHLSLMREGAAPIEWAWWKNGPETFDLPLIALSSKSGDFVAALGFERALWASCNGGDKRACFHLFPDFGDIAGGASATVAGALYLAPGGPEEARARFQADFPEAVFTGGRD